MDALISAHKVAKRLGVKRWKVYGWADANRTPGAVCPSFKVGKNVLFRWSEVAAWLEGRRIRLQAETARHEPADLLEQPHSLGA